jgi:hypothetical protein
MEPTQFDFIFGFYPNLIIKSIEIVFDLESNSVNYFNLCRTIWKVRIFERIPVIRNSDKNSATDQKRWQISKNDLYIHI